MADENIDQASLDLVWNAVSYIQNFKRTNLLKSAPNNIVLIKIKMLLEGLDYGYLGDDFLKMINIKTEVPLRGGGFQFYQEGSGNGYDDIAVSATQKHLNEIEEEVPEVKSLISNIHDLLRRSQETLAEFNEVCSDHDLYVKESLTFYNSYKIPPESFGLASFAKAFSWGSSNIDIAMTFLYAFAESGRAKKYNSIIDAGNKVLVNNISPKEILLIFGLDQVVDPYMLDYINLFSGSSDSLYEWNMTNKNSVIDSITQSVKLGLIDEFAENVAVCSDMGTDEFLSVISDGKLKLDSVKI
jgi:hypothetical protein